MSEARTSRSQPVLMPAFRTSAGTVSLRSFSTLQGAFLVGQNDLIYLYDCRCEGKESVSYTTISPKTSFRVCICSISNKDRVEKDHLPVTVEDNCKCLDAMFRFGCLRSKCGKQASEPTLSTAASASHHEPPSRRRERFNNKSTPVRIGETSRLLSAREPPFSRTITQVMLIAAKHRSMQEGFVYRLKFVLST